MFRGKQTFEATPHGQGWTATEPGRGSPSGSAPEGQRSDRVACRNCQPSLGVLGDWREPSHLYGRIPLRRPVFIVIVRVASRGIQGALFLSRIRQIQSQPPGRPADLRAHSPLRAHKTAARRGGGAGKQPDSYRDRPTCQPGGNL
jgi:hypothetical protein